MVYITKLKDGSFKRAWTKEKLIKTLSELEPEVFEIRVSKYALDYHLCVLKKEHFEKLKFVTDYSVNKG